MMFLITSNSGGESVFAGLSVQTGGLSSFTSGNESTTTPITNPNILWGAVAAAAVGASVAEWQKKREEEERRKVAEMLAAAERGTSKSAKAKYEAMMKHKRIVGESQGLLDKKYAEQKAQKKAQESTHNHLLNEHKSQQSVYVSASQKAQQSTYNHLLNEHKDQQSVYVSKPNTGGGKPLLNFINQIGTLLPTFTPTSTTTPTKTPLPTPTTDNIGIALSYLQYSPQGLALYNELNRKANNVTIEYSTTRYGAMIPTPVVKEYLFGLIKIPTYDVKILVNPQQTPTFIAGTIAHESYHFLTPGGTGLEEYNAYKIGDETRNDIIQAGYGTTADLFAPLSDYTVNTSNPNLGQLIIDLDNWFTGHGIPDYASNGSYNMDPLPTMPTPTFTQTSTPTQTPSPTPTATQTPTPTQTPQPNQLGGNK